MRNKLFIISMAIVVLAGCDEKKEVIEDMLIGKWACEVTVYKTAEADEGGHMDDYQDVPLSNINQQIIYKKENSLITVSTDGQNFKAFKFENSINRGYTRPSKNSVIETKESSEYVFISNNEFKIISDVDARLSDVKIEILKNHAETVCRRIMN